MPNKKHKCRICGKWFASNKDDPKCCSRLCSAKWAARSPARRAYADKVRGTGTRGYPKRNNRHEHRIVAEEKLGRKLRKGETVHHINGDRKDNSPENIVVLKSQAEHARLHRTGYKGTTEMRAKCSAARKAWWARQTKEYLVDYCAKISKARIGYHVKPEVKKKLSLSLKGHKYNTPEVRAKIAAAHTGRKRTAEARANMSAAQKRRFARKEDRGA